MSRCLIISAIRGYPLGNGINRLEFAAVPLTHDGRALRLLVLLGHGAYFYESEHLRRGI